MSNASHANRTCPSLGLMDDPQTSLAFPSIWNNCYRSRPISPPKLKYQEEFCLCENHCECPLFLSEQTLPLPGHIRSPLRRPKRFKGAFWRVLLFILMTLSMAFFLVWRTFLGSLFLDQGEKVTGAFSPTAFLTEFNTINQIVASPLTPTLTLVTATPTELKLPAQTNTPLLLQSKHQLEIPIGTDRKLLIHNVLEGENLDQYEQKYNTSLDAIVAVNFELAPPVWVGTLVVIPIDFVDVADMPSFETYMVTEPGMTVELIAQKFKVNLLDLKYYNAISDGEQLVVGDWLLIPHERVNP